MPPAKRTTVGFDFFRFRNSTGISLPDLFQDIYRTKPNVSDRNLPIDDGYNRIYDWHEAEGVYHGALLRLRTSNLPSIGSETADRLSDLRLQVGEALTEFFGLSYFPAYQILLVHRNRNAGREGQLVNYLERMGDYGITTLEIVVHRDALERLYRMVDCRSAELKIAIPQNLRTLDADISTREAARIAKRTGAASIDIRLSMDHQKTPLHLNVKEILTNALEVYGDSVKKASIRGTVEDEIVTIDLISDRMKETIEVLNPTDSLSLASIWPAAVEAYRRHFDELVRLFQE